MPTIVKVMSAGELNFVVEQDSPYVVIGNDADNIINVAGGAGFHADTFMGGAGNDFIFAGWDDIAIGGVGDDTYVVGSAGNVSIFEKFDEGIDSVFSIQQDYTLPSFVENGTLSSLSGLHFYGWSLVGNDLDNRLEGNLGDNGLSGLDGDDQLFGGAGNDLLDGGTGEDVLDGGDGNDTYVINDQVSRFVEVLRDGFRLSTTPEFEAFFFQVPVEYTANGSLMLLVENLNGSFDEYRVDEIYFYEEDPHTGELFPIFHGYDYVATGYIYPRAHAYTSQLAYFTDSIIDSSGDDTVQASIGHTLQSEIENLQLTGTEAINGTGNAGNNTLTGNGAANVLDGGAGADTMIGGDGNDSYYIDNVGDVVRETNATSASGGTDTVYSYLGSHTLGANVEQGRILAIGTANLSGNGLANTLYAGSGNNVLNGAAGVDTVSYLYAAGAVTISLAVTTAQATGGSGSDTLVAIENLTGSNFNDRLTGNSAANVLNGGTGADTLIGGDGNDVYYVDSAGDLVSETNATASTGGTDVVYSSLAAYTLGANVEQGRILATGTANLTGNGLANTLFAGSGNNVLNGAAGVDTVSYLYAASAVTISLAVTTAQATGGSGSDTLVAIENLTGSNFNDRLVGDSAANVLNGGTGTDTLIGGDGSDIYYVDNAGDLVSETNALISTGGTDTVYSYLAAYTLGAHVEQGRILATGAANLTGNGLANTLFAGSGNNVLNGGAGVDTLSYLYASSAVTASLAVTTAQATGGSGADSLVAIENLTGSNFNDRLTGNSAVNVLNGGKGADTLIGGDGSDVYYVDNAGDLVSETNAVTSTGGSDLVYSALATYVLGANVEQGRILATGTANLTGNGLANTLFAGNGNNVLNGGAGVDTVSYLHASSAVVASLAVTTAQATGGSGSDTLVAIERLIGSNFNDRLTGNSGSNLLNGGAGNDLLVGGLGKDTLVGGSGNDTFDFNALSEMGVASTTWDVITDFTRGADKIDLSTLDANAATVANDAFTAFIGSAAAFTQAGQLKLANGVLYGNTDADSAAEFAIQLTGISGLSTSDLIL
ncbi:M10 family metallopeptidase C-terminal domain-containing protein [Metapseudomonas furukawaii]|uniref:M10 family metallopeptidase C-terminal domain-containing protein n=1 Tax=Metapseudomonas furukawaii TaxID=1149133 RepID=UPI00404621CD